MTILHARLFGLIACVWGGVLLYFYHSQRVRHYLAESFHHFILFGGIGILILGVYSVISPREKKSSCSHDHDHGGCDHDHHEHKHDRGESCDQDHGESCDHDHKHEHCEHDHHHHDHGESCDHDHEEGHGPWITGLLTLVPLFMAMNYSTDRFSFTALEKKKASAKAMAANASANRPPFTRADLEKNVSRNEHGEFQMRLISVFYAAGDREIQGIFEGLPVELEGRIAPEKLNNEAGNRMRIFRKIITCCAADIQMVDVTLDFPEEATRPALNDWVKAGGTLTFETIGGEVYPILKVREVVQTEEPYSEFQQRQ